jgi:hypothetical protein
MALSPSPSPGGHVGASSRLRDRVWHRRKLVAPVGAAPSPRMPFVGLYGCATREDCLGGGFRPPAPSYFSLRGQREGNQEKGRPGDAPLSGFPALLMAAHPCAATPSGRLRRPNRQSCRLVARGGGLPTGHPWPVVRRRTSMCAPLRGLIRLGLRCSARHTGPNRMTARLRPRCGWGALRALLLCRRPVPGASGFIAIAFRVGHVGASSRLRDRRWHRRS